MSSPKHALLTDELRQRIADGAYPDGRMPSEAKLTIQFKVSRTTVRAALLALQNEGLLRAESGVGYFVRKLEHFSYRPQDDFKRDKLILDAQELMNAETLPPVEADSFVRAGEGRNPTQKIEVSIVAAPVDVRRRMGLPDGEFVVRRSRLRRLDGEPFQLNDSFYPREVAEGTEIMQPGDITRGANQVLAEQGYAQVRALDEIWVRMPSRSEIERLRILPGTPVAEHIVTGFTAEGRVVRMVRAVLPGDRNVIMFERTHPDHEAEAVR